MMQAVNKDRGMNHALKPTLFLKFSGSEAQVRDEIATVGDIVKVTGFARASARWPSTCSDSRARPRGTRPGPSTLLST
jgi:hypothetical protein